MQTITAYTVQVGRKRYPVPSLEMASAIFCAARDRSRYGSRRTPTPLIYDTADRLVGYVSYNGRVWAGHPHDWKPGDKPLCEAGA